MRLSVVEDEHITFRIRGANGFSCVFVADGERVVVHHASAQLGTAVYVRASDGTYDPQSKEYVWKAADVMMREEGWMGTTIRPGVQEQELTFERETIGTRRHAIAYIVLPASNELDDAKVATWPVGLTDGVANVQLVAGFNPDDVAFQPERWALRPAR